MIYQRSIRILITVNVALKGAIAMPKAVNASSGPWTAHAGESYLQNTAFPAWISLFRAATQFSNQPGRTGEKMAGVGGGGPAPWPCRLPGGCGWPGEQGAHKDHPEKKALAER